MKSIDKIQKAMNYAFAHRPQVEGFPFLAECLRKAGVKKNVWTLPAGQSVYIMESGEWVVQQSEPLVKGMVEVAPFDQEALITALRADQAGQTTFPEFLQASWNAGVVGYEVDFDNRTVAYKGIHGETYTESYSHVFVLDFFE